MNHTHWLRTLCFLAAGWALAGCALSRDDRVPASVSGVNYTDRDIVYRLFDPADPKQKVLASETLGPFSAGGVTCCYPVPKSWRPGAQVGVKLDVYDDKGDKLPRETFIVELPPYDKSGAAGDVWFIYYPDRTVGVVSTAYRPNGDEWPGKVKGWPKPSLAYQRELWERDMRLAQEALTSDKQSMQHFLQNPQEYLRNQWNFYLDHNKRSVGQAKEPSMFAGPDDPGFLVHEREALERVLAYSQRKVDRLLEIKP